MLKHIEKGESRKNYYVLIPQKSIWIRKRTGKEKS